ncbi:MAG: hypothetical protein ACFFG0_43360 [Candidatus Thorarchaeota archaeon]
MESEKTEIIDFSGEKFNKFTVPFWIVAIFIFSMSILNILFIVIFPESQTTIYFSIVLIVIFILYYYFIVSNSPGKLRKFSISNECIEVLLPNKPKFSIYWSEFEKVEVRLKIIEFKPFYVYHIYFLHQNSEKKLSVSLDDFHRAKIIEFLKIIREYAYSTKKEFIAVKETNISGVYLVEDLEIF